MRRDRAQHAAPGAFLRAVHEGTQPVTERRRGAVPLFDGKRRAAMNAVPET